MCEINMNEHDRPEMPEKVEFRLQQVKYEMEEEIKTDALVITYLPNIRYLTNYSGSAATLFLTSDAIYFVTDDRYEEQVKRQLYKLPNMKVFVTRYPWKLITDGVILKDVETLAFEADRMSYSEVIQLRNDLKPLKLKPAVNPVERYTIAKTPEELEYIKQSCNTAEKVFEEIKGILKPGMSEKELAAEIIYRGRKLGSEGDAFDVISVSGERSALVHGQPSNKIIEKGDIVLMDFGCVINGFVSDITSTVAVGSANDEQKDLYKLLFEAKEKAIEAVHEGVNGKFVDLTARNIIEKAGFGKYFQHSLGHGIGLAEHEMPIITFRSDEYVVPENSMLAIEPGVYLPNKFGIRIEDDILVGKKSATHITHASPELEII